jgi:ERCC4-type nuclease
MKFIIDNRERHLIEVLKKIKGGNKNFENIEIELANIELGDINFVNENEEIIIFERKTIADLIASIKDGRYAEQSFRLNGYDNVCNHNIIYIIEGNINSFVKEKQMIYSSIFSLNYYKGFSVYKSENLHDTAYYLLNNFIKINKEKNKVPFYKNNIKKINEDENFVYYLEEENDGDEESEKNYCSLVKKKKNENINVNNFGEIVLCQIPSINSVTAVAIMKEYKNINNLVDALKKDMNCLNEIKYTTNKEQKRKISKLCIENIKKFLLI